jgi:threonine dehydratase
VKYLRPDIKVFAVESDDAACLKAALDAGERVTLPHVGLFADGTAVAKIGEETFRLIRKHIDGVITVNTDEICAAIKDIFDDTRSIAEPSGALALAGLKKYVEQNAVSGQTLVAIESGANTNFDRLRYIAERTEIGEKREAILAVTIPEKPGSFKTFCSLIGKRGITEFNYRFADTAEAQIFVGLQTAPGGTDHAELVAQLRSEGYAVLDLTDSELAKLHIRHLVGGPAPDSVKDEVVFRFEFPERPGALLNFLTQLGLHRSWNISLFHYRNHGAADGRVLVGMQVPANEQDALQAFLEKVGYPWQDETANPAYRLFLSNK